MMLSRTGTEVSAKVVNQKTVIFVMYTPTELAPERQQVLHEKVLEFEPTAELSYILGVMFGDGCLYEFKNKHEFQMKLETIDKDFVEKFSNCASRVIGESENYNVRYCKPQQSWRPTYATTVGDKNLCMFVKSVKKDFEKGKPIFEKFPSEFIQGLADSEGFPSIIATNRFSVRLYALPQQPTVSSVGYDGYPVFDWISLWRDKPSALAGG